jgi:hypothetical protein
MVQVSSMFASICSGTFIGLGFAVLLTYQQVRRQRNVQASQLRDAVVQGLFTELPFVFLFPTGLCPPPPPRMTCHPVLKRCPPTQLLLRHRDELRRQRARRRPALSQHNVRHHIRDAQRLTLPRCVWQQTTTGARFSFGES